MSLRQDTWLTRPDPRPQAGCYGVSHNDNTHNDIVHNDVTHNVSSHNTTLVIKDVSHNDITHNTKRPATFVIILNLGVAMPVVIIKI